MIQRAYSHQVVRGNDRGRPTVRKQLRACLISTTNREISFTQSEADFTVRGGYQACAQLLADSRPTAIVAANDLMAIGALNHAFDRGLSVPGEISITGFDNIAFSKYTHPALTTVSVAREEIGRLAFKALVQMISAPDAPGGE